MKPAGLKTTEPTNSTDHRSGLSVSVARWNFNQVWRAPDAFGLIWKEEEKLALILEENGSEDPAKSRISNRQLSVDSGTLLTGLKASPETGAKDSRGGAENAEEEVTPTQREGTRPTSDLVVP